MQKSTGLPTQQKRMIINGQVFNINDPNEINAIKKDMDTKKEEKRAFEIANKNKLNVVKKNTTNMPVVKSTSGFNINHVQQKSLNDTISSLSRVPDKISLNTKTKTSSKTNTLVVSLNDGLKKGPSKFNVKRHAPPVEIKNENTDTDTDASDKQNANENNNTNGYENMNTAKNISTSTNKNKKESINTNTNMNASKNTNATKNKNESTSGNTNRTLTNGKQVRFNLKSNGRVLKEDDPANNNGTFRQNNAGNEFEQKQEMTAVIDIVDKIEIDTSDPSYYTNTFNVSKNQWYVLVVKLPANNEGVMKIVDGNKHNLLPTVIFPNQYFLYNTTKTPGTDESVGEYRIYVKSSLSSSIVIHVVGTKVIQTRIQQISKDIAKSNVDIWKFRKFFDVNFSNFYVNALQLSLMPKFLDRLKSDYTLFKNPNYFDSFVDKLDLNLSNVEKIDTEGQTSVLYLLYSTVEYENTGYTIRSHYLLKSTNDDKYKVYGVSRFGYPFDRDKSYYNTVDDKKVIDNITYVKLLSGNDSFNDNTLMEYLKKYIVSTIYLAHKVNAKVIHGVSNFWNGLVAYYASKYLKIKSIYEIRGFWDESTSLYKPGSEKSDYINMMVNLENKIISSVDRVITINQPLKNRVIKNNDVPDDKVNVLYNCVDTSVYFRNDDMRKQARDALQLNENDILMGYIGSILMYEGIEYVVECVKKLNDRGYSVKFILAGDGSYRQNIIDSAKVLKDNFVYLGKIDHADVINYYNAMDIVAFPRKDNSLCQSTSSYKIFETMACEKPIIVSKLDAYKEIIEDNVTGLYCIPDDKDSLYEKIELLINDKELRETLGKNAREWVCQNREWSNNGEQLRKIYDELLG
jgi:glycosyltransferase involved in cell wall biosynthesis